MKPLVYNAIVGNGKMLAALDGKGEIHRLYWPHIDMLQHINVTWAALLSPALGDRAIRLDDEDTWQHTQDYIDDSCILETRCIDKYNRLEVRVLDFVLPDKDILVRRFTVENRCDTAIPATLIYYSSLFVGEGRHSHTNFYDPSDGTLFHYRRDNWLAVAGDKAPTLFQCGIAQDQAIYGNLAENRLAMSPDGCQAWDLGTLEPGAAKEAVVVFAAGHDRAEVWQSVAYVREQGWDNLFGETSAFWRDYLAGGRLPAGADEEMARLFKRSVMVSKLLMNKETGGIIAAPEFDENCNHCGGYSFCWVRDAVIIAQAMLKSGYPEYARQFYRWAARTQEPSGGWPQRLYSCGRLAPRWGDQIDETGAAVWGIWQFFSETGDRDFLKEMWPVVEKAAEFLIGFISPETGRPDLSWDLWEERFGEHAYSWAAVYAGLKSAGRIAQSIGHPEKAPQWLEAASALQENILDYFWDQNLSRFLRTRWLDVEWHVYEESRRAGKSVREVPSVKGRNTHQVFGDDTADSSLLGLAVPYEVIKPDDRRMQQTVNCLKETLSNSVVGGMKRYQNDSYIGGNPWVITTLWLGMFEAAAGDWDNALGRLRWALRHTTAIGLLPEQVDRESGRPAWVVPLAWSHAMYLILLNMLDEAGKI